MSTPSTLDPVAWPLLSTAELAAVSAFGSERPTAAGEVLFAAGEASDDLFVLLEGEAEVVRSDGPDDEPVATFAAGGFIGELTLLTGQRRFLTARVTRAGRVLVIASDELRRLMSAQPALAEKLFSAFVARRELLRSGRERRRSASSDQGIPRPPSACGPSPSTPAWRTPGSTSRTRATSTRSSPPWVWVRRTPLW